ncbi:MAG TPA: hypothetical protein RMH26_31580, partial [Polyangiaceae bacterium LLY-WYZ-15_(1-7)]|nr:hypothetical protein [Polyangiaceae bacterium LLY-WYZ-15_(1-7)]
AALQEWEAIVNVLRESRPALAAVLEHGVPRVVTAERLVVSFQDGSFYGRQADTRDSRAAIADAARVRLRATPEIEIRFDAEDGATASKTVAAVEAGRREAEQKARRLEALGHPVVRDAMDVFPEARGSVEVRLEGD